MPDDARKEYRDAVDAAASDLMAELPPMDLMRVILRRHFRPSGCPCLHTTPCSDQCSCAHRGMSAGCRRCASYGSTEQRRAAAERLARIIDEHELALIQAAADDASPMLLATPPGWEDDVGWEAARDAVVNELATCDLDARVAERALDSHVLPVIKDATARLRAAEARAVAAEKRAERWRRAAKLHRVQSIASDHLLAESAGRYERHRQANEQLDDIERRVAVAAAEGEVARLRAMLVGLIDEEPCRPDEAGFCDEHGRWDCQIQAARKYLADSGRGERKS